jgi:phosphoribosylaminoimidazole-succinocarboxamide synthase
MNSLYKSTIKSLPLLGHGKVRDNYAVGDDKILIVTTDRLSAFDVVMNEPIPGKGMVLNQMSDFWFEKLGHIVVAKRLKPILVEAVVRGYIIGSGWKDYQESGAVCGIQLPAGLRQADKLPQPLFTPAAKADIGEHDENISFEDMENRIGKELAAKMRDISIQLYTTAAEYAATRGIIIADTKFEFGLDDNGVLHLMDEVLTADSSRFWPADSYAPGMSPPSFDKQFVRDYLETLTDWGKTAPAPALPQDVIEKTQAKYFEAIERLTGEKLKA